MNHFWAQYNISRENYLNESLFLQFFNIWWNKQGRWSQKFAAGVTKLMTPDEIRSFDGRGEKEQYFEEEKEERDRMDNNNSLKAEV